MYSESKSFSRHLKHNAIEINLSENELATKGA